MPCNTVIQVSVKLERVDKAVLARALTSLGLVGVVKGDRVSGLGVEWANGKLALSSRSGLDVEARVNAIKKAYSSECVRTAAKRFGWQFSEEALADGSVRVRVEQRDGGQ